MPPSGGSGQWAGIRRALRVVVVYLVLGTLLDWAATQFQATEGVSLWYPPPALDVFVLLVFGLRYLPALVLSGVLHATVVDPVGLGPLHVVVSVAISTVVYGGAAAVLLRWVRIDPRIPTLRDVAWLVLVACGGASLLVAVGQVTLLCVAGVVAWGELPLSIAGRWAGSATGIAMLAPVLLLLARRWTSSRAGGWPRGWTRRPALPADPDGSRVSSRETFAQFAVLLAAVYAAYAGGPGASMDYTYLVYAPVVWIAVRGGLRVAAPAVLVANVAAVAFNGGRVPGEGGIALQFGLVTLTVTGLLLGALVMQRRLDSDRNRHAALHDPLTGLPNRVLFTDRLDQAAARAARDPARRFAVLFCDLDNFKQVNDSLGHPAGDRLLTEVAHRLRTVSRPADSLARLGGDEFAVLLEELHNPEEMHRIISRMLEELARPHGLTDAAGPVVVTVSIGSVLNRPGVPVASQLLLDDADVALHQAKRDGRNRHVLFDQGMHTDAATRLQRETALRQAVAEGHIEVAFQPVVRCDDLTVVAMEALARWTAPEGPVAPSTFIPLAEQTGLIHDLGEHVLRRACAIAVTWPTGGPVPVRLAVNASWRELTDHLYTDRLLAVLQETGLAPENLDVEITETQGLEDSDTVRTTLRGLARAGVGVLVDDFGTGYSSFTYLHTLPISGLKIDRSFVAGLPDHHQHATIVRSILAMAAELALPVTAEGVETPEQLAFLQQHHCAYAQGYLFNSS